MLSGATHGVAPTRPTSPIPASAGAIVGQFRSLCAKRINHVRDTPGAPVWQRNYHESIVHSERESEAVRFCIKHNPACWSEDTENPDCATAER